MKSAINRKVKRNFYSFSDETSAVEVVMNIGEPSYAAQSRRQDVVTSASIAGYIFEISGELTIMAEQGKLNLLAYLLSMVHAEAENLREPACGPVPDIEPLTVADQNNR